MEERVWMGAHFIELGFGGELFQLRMAKIKYDTTHRKDEVGVQPR